MAKKKRRAPVPPAVPPESPVSLWVTVGWTLSVLTTLGCATVSALVWAVARDRPADDPVFFFARLLHFAAIVTSCLSLLLLPVVLKVRREPPPRGFVVFAIVVAALPLVAALL